MRTEYWLSLGFAVMLVFAIFVALVAPEMCMVCVLCFFFGLMISGRR